MKKLFVSLVLAAGLTCSAVAQTGKGTGFNNPEGFFMMVETRLPTLVMNYGYVGADAVGGWRFCPEFAAGVGVGAESVLFSSMQIPVYLHLRSDITATRVSPYIALNIGYNFELKHLDDMNNLSGFFAAPSLGVSYNVGSLRMTTGLEFRFQRAIGKVGDFIINISQAVMSLRKGRPGVSSWDDDDVN